MKKQMENKTFIDELLQGEQINNVDWIRCGKYIRRIVNPPGHVSKDGIKHFSDGLKLIIPLKLEEALRIKESLKELRKRRLTLIVNKVPKKHQWFYLLLESHLYSEFFAISKWVNYWLDLWYEVKGKSKPNYKNNGPISDDAIRRAKEYPIENLYEGKLRKSGGRFNGLCPFHQEKTPSFFIFPDNHWHCFGACSEGGDSISFIMKLKNLDFIKAVKQLNHE